MEMLTESLGVEKPSIYASFGSKKALYIEALERYQELVTGLIRSMLESGESPRKGIERAMRTLMSPSRKRTRKGCLMTNSALEIAEHDPEVRSQVGKILSSIQSLFAQAVEAAQAKGEIRRDIAPPVLAQFLVNAFEGVRVTERTRVADEHSAAVADLALSILDR